MVSTLPKHFTEKRWHSATGRMIPKSPVDLEDWERAVLDHMAHEATKHLPEEGVRWTRSIRYAVVYSALVGIYRINKNKGVENSGDIPVGNDV